MRLPDAKLDIGMALREFDIWVTPTLGEVRDTDKFKSEHAELVRGFQLLKDAARGFPDEGSCSPTALVPAIQTKIGGLGSAVATDALSCIIQALLNVTGKTDNNVKCQFPIYLRDVARITSIPSPSGGGLKLIPVPRVLKADRIVQLVVALAVEPTEQERLLRRYLEFILSDRNSTAQLWALGSSFAALESIGKGADLLAPLAIFQVRGSVSASGGHDPEELLRGQLAEWGLIPGVDFNQSDVTLRQLLGASGRPPGGTKTRAYDFVLPFASKPAGPRIFVQAQFYAGDSGSVSHKNVDQTRSTRDATSVAFPDAMFVEYVDGAGYFGSLNADLRSLLSMPDTAGFFQIRSVPIRLRRAMQTAGFLVPLQIEHAILRVGSDMQGVRAELAAEGYATEEIERAIGRAIAANSITCDDLNRLHVTLGRRPIARRYFLLDVACIEGRPLQTAELRGYLLLPGYGPFFGLKQNHLLQVARTYSAALAEDWSDVTTVLDDLQWLVDRGFVTSSGPGSEPTSK